MPTNHLKSFDIVGKKESVSNYLSMLDPTDTPFLSSIGNENIDQTYHQWLEDQLRSERKNTALEGADAQDTDRDQPQMRGNGTQILTETFRVSGTSQAVKMYGRKGAVNRETMKTGKLVRMDLEHSLVGTGQTYVAATPSVEGEFAGVQAQISPDTTVDNGGTPRALDEDQIISVTRKMYNEGSEASTLMVKPTDTEIVADFSQASGRTENVANTAKKVSRVVNIYEGPYGTVRVTKNRRMRSSDAIAYDAKNWKLLTLRGWSRTKLAKNGDSDRWQVLGEFSLKHVNQKASGLITDLSETTA